MNDRSQSHEFLTRFFSPPGNQIRLEDIDHPQRPQNRLRPIVDRIRARVWLPSILPRRVNASRVIWYGVAPDHQQLRILFERVVAFVGPSYSTLRTQLTTFNPEDDLEESVLEFSNSCAFRFEGPIEEVWKTVQLMDSVMERSPKRTSIQSRTVDLLLRDLDSYLNSGNRIGAESVLAAIRDRGYVDSLNLLFLRVRMLGELNAWREILELPELSDLMLVRRPRLVTSFLLEGVYIDQLSTFESNGDSKGAAAHFRASIEKQYPALLTVRSGFHKPAALKLLMLASVAGSPPDPETRDAILSASGLNDLDTAWLRSLAGLLTAPPAVPIAPSLDRAVEALFQRRYDIAFETSLLLQPSRAAGEILLQSAVELSTPSVAGSAINAFVAYPEDLRVEVLQSRVISRAWQDLTLAYAPSATEPEARQVPTSWLAWLDALNADANSKHLAEIARLESDTWGVDAVLDASDGVEAILQGLSRTRTPEQERILQSVLPLLYRDMESADGSRRTPLAPVFEALHTILLLADRFSDADLDFHNDLVRSLLSLGQAALARLSSDGAELWNRIQSPARLEWALDLLEILLNYSGDPAAELVAFANSIAAFIARNGGRMDAEVVRVARFLLASAGVELTVSGRIPDHEDAGSAVRRLRGSTVLLYSLQPNVAQRVERLLRAESGGITVHISQDKAGSAHLRSMVKQSDVLVIATRAATHSATGFIEMHKARHATVLRASGKGSISMWAALVDFARGGASVRLGTPTIP